MDSDGKLRVKGTYPHLKSALWLFSSGKVFWVSLTMSNFPVMYFPTILAFQSTKHSSDLTFIGQISEYLLSVCSFPKPSRLGGQRLFGISISRGTSAPGAEHGTQQVLNGDPRELSPNSVVFLSPLCEITFIDHYCFTVSLFKIMYFLPQPPLLHDHRRQWRKYPLKPRLGSGDLRLFVFKVSKSCKVNMILFSPCRWETGVQKVKSLAQGHRTNEEEKTASNSCLVWL